VGDQRALVVAARRYWRVRLADPDLDLVDTAAAVGCSPRSLQRAFAAGGTTYRDALRGLRMQRARRLLERGESVRSVVSRVGYRGVSGLVAAFKREYGMPPSAVQPRTPAYLGSWIAEHTDTSATL
jgi:AraC-like DNA-binding protein